MRLICFVVTVVVLACTSQSSEAEGIWYTPYGYFYGRDLGNGVGYGYGIGVALAENANGLNAFVSSDFALIDSPNSSTGSEFVSNSLETHVNQIVPSQPMKKIVKEKKSAAPISSKKPVKNASQKSGTTTHGKVAVPNSAITSTSIQ
jgi:hypothetical protein